MKFADLFGVIFLLRYWSYLYNIASSQDDCRIMPFLKPLQGQMLENHVIRTIGSMTVDSCAVSCYMEPYCVSYNFQATNSASPKRCDLNNSTHVEHPDDLVAQPTFVYCSTENACNGNLCKHNATCQSGYTDKGYRCLCIAGYTAEHCDVEINECQSNPCLNGAQCVDEFNQFTCTCAAGFNGTRCEIDINECASNPCQNSGTCTDYVNGYTCSCLPGFTGGDCKHDIDECDSSPCENGATCHDVTNGYNCSCQPGFNGTHCENDIDDCTGNPCSNEGSCQDRTNTYFCSCPPEFIGQRCETVPLECSSYTELLDPTRLRSYGDGNNCDKTLTEGWYRYSGGAGNKMASSGITSYERCGTTFPGYVTGSHPNIWDGKQGRSVYFWDNNCQPSDRKIDIYVRDCGTFYVYYLKPLPNSLCNGRYCGSN